MKQKQNLTDVHATNINSNSITTNYLFPILAFFPMRRTYTYFSRPFHMLLENVFIFWILKWITIFIIIKQKLWDDCCWLEMNGRAIKCEARTQKWNGGSQRKWNGNGIESNRMYWLHWRNVSKGVRQLNILTSDKNVEWRSAESNSSHITCDNKNAIGSDRCLKNTWARKKKKTMNGLNGLNRRQ